MKHLNFQLFLQMSDPVNLYLSWRADKSVAMLKQDNFLICKELISTTVSSYMWQKGVDFNELK